MTVDPVSKTPSPNSVLTQLEQRAEKEMVQRYRRALEDIAMHSHDFESAQIASVALGGEVPCTHCGNGRNSSAHATYCHHLRVAV